MAKKTSQVEEVWKTIKFDFEYVNDNKFQVSNLGRVRTFNKASNGNILDGSMLNGYKVMRLKFFKEKDPVVKKTLETKKAKIEKFNERSKKLNNDLKLITTKNPSYKLIVAELADIETKRFALRTDYNKQFDKEQKKISFRAHFMVHRMVAKYFLPKPPKAQKFVMHLDHDKLNNRASNLAWGTMKETAQNYVKSDRFKQVIAKRLADNNSGYSKLTNKEVVSIKKKLRKGKTLRSIATEYNVSDMQIHRIKTGENWSHIVI
jgi:hypothetical protein